MVLTTSAAERLDGAVHAVRMQLCDLGLHCSSSSALAGSDDSSTKAVANKGEESRNAFLNASRRDCSAS